MARKRGQPIQTPRPWAGAKYISVEGEGLYVLTTQTKWDRAKTLMTEFLKDLEEEAGTLLEVKWLEKAVGFLCHISRTYPAMFSYLRSFYNTLNGWRCGRNLDGWKMGSTEWMELIAGDIAFKSEQDITLPFESRQRKFSSMPSRDMPELVKPVPCFKDDLQALKLLLSKSEPSLHLVRGNKIGVCLVGFGDASGGGFGSSWDKESFDIAYRFGTWGPELDDGSSNLREFTNLADTLEEMGRQGDLKNMEVFLFTDNSTSEAAYFNGTSQSPELFKLILRIRCLEMHFGAHINVCHFAGKRMIAHGSDGLSRGNLNISVMAGKKMLDFVLIHKSCLDRCDLVKTWLLNWMGDDPIEFLTPKQWFSRGYDLVDGEWEINVDGVKMSVVKPGFFIWSPPPAAAVAAIEE